MCWSAQSSRRMPRSAAGSWIRRDRAWISSGKRKRIWSRSGRSWDPCCGSISSISRQRMNRREDGVWGQLTPCCRRGSRDWKSWRSCGRLRADWPRLRGRCMRESGSLTAWKTDSTRNIWNVLPGWERARQGVRAGPGTGRAQRIPRGYGAAISWENMRPAPWKSGRRNMRKSWIGQRAQGGTRKRR